MVPAGERPEDRGGVPVMVEERTHREAAAVQVEQRPEHRSEVSAVIVERPEVDRAAVEADLDLPAGGGVPRARSPLTQPMHDSSRRAPAANNPIDLFIPVPFRPQMPTVNNSTPPPVSPPELDEKPPDFLFFSLPAMGSRCRKPVSGMGYDNFYFSIFFCSAVDISRKVWYNIIAGNKFPPSFTIKDGIEP